MLALAAALLLGVLLGAATNCSKEGAMLSRIRRTMFGTRRRKIASTAATLMLASGVAFAAWMISAAGPGRGEIGSLTAPTVKATAAASEVLYPGQTAAGDFRIDNPNSGPLVITSTDMNNGATEGFTSECPATVVEVQHLTGLSVQVPPGNDQAVTIPGLFRLADDAPTQCQGISFTKAVALGFSSP